MSAPSPDQITADAKIVGARIYPSASSSHDLPSVFANGALYAAERLSGSLDNDFRSEITRIADDYYPDRSQDAELALSEMRAALRAALTGAKP